MKSHEIPGESPYVDIPGYVSQTRPPPWGSFYEQNILLVLEAHQRFLVATQDPRLAATLTLAWATISPPSE